METPMVVMAIACLLVGIALTWIIRKLVFEKNYLPVSRFTEVNDRLQKVITEKALAEEKAKTLLQEVQILKSDKAQVETNSRREIIELTKQVAELQAQLQTQSQLYVQQKGDLEQMTDKLKKDFSLLANTILDEKTQKFNDLQQKELTTLLSPFKTSLSEFKEQVEKTYKTENDDRISLREQVINMMNLNERLSKEAKALTMALTGSTKKQGDWGELVLESILEYCGLQKGIHYFTQETAENNAGDKIRPDILVKYPNNRTVIIDSKVSLQHYEQLCREENPDAQGVLVKSMLQSFYNHIDGLSGKSYTDISNSLDMVIMFIPVEAAYITVLQNDPELQHYAYRKNVLFISTSNLILAMKLIFDMWKKDAINKNAAAVAERAGRLYDKLAGFVENFDRIGKALGTLQNTYDDAHKQLTSGKGSIIAHAEKMRQLEIKAGKQILSKYISEASTQEALSAEEE